MRIKILSMGMILLLAGFLAMTANAKPGNGSTPTRAAYPAAAQPAATGTPTVCTVTTGIDPGKVNLRQCAGTSCGVIALLSTGETLLVIHPGEWTQVRTGGNVIGYINSTYCK